MEAFRLFGPDGVTYAWVCSKCRHIGGAGTCMTSNTDENVARYAEGSRAHAEQCCTCKHCGKFYDRWSDNIPEEQDVMVWQPSDCCDMCWPTQRVIAEDGLARHAEIQKNRMGAREASLREARNQNAALLLDSRIREISEETWCAGWSSEIESDLWEAACGSGDLKYGMGLVTERELASLMDYANEAGGWWTYDRFVPFEEWLTLFADWKHKS